MKFNSRSLPFLSTFFVVLSASLLVLGVREASADSVKVLRYPDGYEVTLFEPISVLKADLGNGLTTYAISDDNSDGMGVGFTLAIQETPSGRTMTTVANNSGIRTDVPPGSLLEQDLLGLIASHT